MEGDEYNGKRMRHIRRIKVFQYNRIVEYVEDIGKGNGTGFIIPGGIRKSNGHYESLHTVGELQDVAAEFKLVTKAADLMALAQDQEERRSSARQGRKVYGKRYDIRR